MTASDQGKWCALSLPSVYRVRTDHHSALSGQTSFQKFRARCEGMNVESIKAVFFDVGEVLVNETREYGTWADWLGVPRHTFSAVFGSMIALGHDYRDTFQIFKPGFNLAEERDARASEGRPESFSEDDLYPDARVCLESLRSLHVRVGVAGNQTARAEEILRSLHLPIDVLGTSDGWGVEKPSQGFFQRVVQESLAQAEHILYVGDRIDNDVRAAQEAGLQTALIRRGPWGYILREPALEERCLFLLNSLAELPELVRAHNESLGGND